MKLARVIMVTVVAAAVSACGEGEVLESTSTSDPDRATLGCEVVAGDQLDATEPVPVHLWVSNQSFDVDPVDIQIYVDEQQVVCDSFRVESQHSWILFELELDEGEHSLRAVGLDGQVELAEAFTVSNEHWGLVEFWTEEGRNFFTFHVQDEPIYFA
jgi:hypothetical protein